MNTYQTEFALGEAAQRSGNAAAAREHFAAACALAGGDAEAVDALGRLGRAHATLGDFDAAQRVLHEASRRAAKDSRALALVRRHMGAVSWMRGDMQAARAYLEEAQAGFKALGLLHDRTLTLTLLGLVLATMGVYQRAIGTLEECIDLYAGLKDEPGVITSTNDLGECYYALGALDQAFSLFVQAQESAARAGRPEFGIDPLRNQARVYAATGAWEPALEAAQQAVVLARGQPRKHLLSQALATLAEVRRLRGECAEARETAAELFALPGASASDCAEARLTLGQIVLVGGSGASALVELEAGLLDAQKTFNEMLILRFHAALGQVVDHPDLAQVHRRIARELAEEIADGLTDRSLQQRFRASALFRSIGG